MDYARFNYVAQPEDGVTQFGPMVGEYDDWATKWTYSWIAGDRTPDEEFLILNEWVKERADDPAMLFLSGFGIHVNRQKTSPMTKWRRPVWVC